MEQLRILNFGIDESDSGSSSRWLLDKFRISKLVRFAIAGGNTKNTPMINFQLIFQFWDFCSPEILLWLRVMRVTNSMLTRSAERGEKFSNFREFWKIYKHMGVSVLIHSIFGHFKYFSRSLTNVWQLVERVHIFVHQVELAILAILRLFQDFFNFRHILANTDGHTLNLTHDKNLFSYICSSPTHLTNVGCHECVGEIMLRVCISRVMK